MVAKSAPAKEMIKDKMKSQKWRLNNLYHIVTDEPYSEDVIFKMATRPVLETFYDSMWYWNLILKARQHGITTEIDLFMLDTCLFNDNIHAGIIAHDLKSAQRIFYNKIKYPYKHLPEELKTCRLLEKSDSMELRFSNGSCIWVGTSMRSATLRMLHISELAKICAKFPEKALEIKTGAIPTLHEGSYLFVESTAEGPAGMFYDAAQLSELLTGNADRQNRKLNKQEMRFHFFPWFEHPGNKTDPTGIRISDTLKDYFKTLQGKEDIVLTLEQMAWYAMKRDGPGGLGKLMKRENPATVQEAFESAVEGAIYGEDMELARNEGRIGFYPWVKTMPVYTFWDLGYRHATCVTFAQFIKEQIRIIDFHGEKGRGAAYHAARVREKDYVYGDHFFPHDVMNHEKGSGIVLKDTYDSLLCPPGQSISVVERPRLKADGISAVSDCFNSMVFNEPTTKELCKALSFYRYEWDDTKVCFGKDPVDDWAADPADSVQSLAMQYRYGTIGGQTIGYPKPLPANVGMRKERSDPLSKYRVKVGARR